MLKGLELPVLAKKVEEGQRIKRDFTILTSDVELFSFDGSAPLLKGVTERPLVLNETAQRQMAEWSGIGWRYWQQCWEKAPGMVCSNMNHWLKANDHRRLFRCYDDPNGSARLRAFLSDRYQRADNYDLLQTVLPVLGGIPGLRWEASHLSDDRLYLKVFSPEQTIEPKKGDVLETGLMIKNEETGLGSLMICPMTLRLVCTNGMVHMEHGQRITHTKRAGFGNDAKWSQETQRLTDLAMAAQIKDTLADILSGQWAQKIERQMQRAMGIEFKSPVKDAEKLLGKYELPKSDCEPIISQFFIAGEPTLFGLVNAVTHIAHSHETDFEKSTQLEEVGGRMLASVR